MSEPQATRDPVDEFLRVLDAELTCLPSELSTLRHVKNAASTARRRHTGRKGLAIRSGAAAAAAAMILSTSGVALAGGLPRPVQTMVADAAQMLPVPLPIPYPNASTVVEVSEKDALSDVEPTPDAAVASKEASESRPSVSESSVDSSDSGTEATTSQATSRSWEGERRDDDGQYGRFDRDDTSRDEEDGHVADDSHWDGSNDDNRGWDDTRDRDWRSDRSDRDRYDNDQDRSRRDDRDR